MPPLLPISSFAIRRMVLDRATITLEAEATTASATCPSCGVPSDQIHDRYDRHPSDLPWRGCPVRLVLRVRRFRCSNPQCARRTFAEDFAPTVPRRSQRTAEAHALLFQFAWMMGGEAGARLAHAAGLPVSPDTLLRALRRAESDEVETPGVDDLALRRGQRYATILVDLELSEPIDLLAGREAETLAKWLREHPGVEVIVRDRLEAYAEGARAGAPDAVQVADRFHLVRNASAAMDELLQGRRRQIAVEVSEPPPPPPEAPVAKPLSPTKQRMADRRAARIARWEEVQRRHREGEGLRHMARELGISRVTVRRLIDTPIPPRNHIVHPRPGGLSSPSLQPYVSYLQDRWQQGCHNITQLFREIVEQGYPGSRSLLYTALRGWREPRPPPQERHRRNSRRFGVRWLCLRPPDQLTPDESLALQQLLKEDARLATGYDLLQRFRTLITERNVAALDVWLHDAHESNLAPFVGMANGIVKDRAAVEAALTMPWSTSMVEGHIHRVKLIKRQGYGRSGLKLLRRRILAA